MDKTNFLALYTEAQAKTLTPQNIKVVFRKTGVIPFNPNVVTKEMMASSLVTSTQSMVPVQQSSAIKVMLEMVIDYMDYQKLQPSAGKSSAGPSATSEASSAPIFIQSAMNSLTATAVAFLISLSDIISTSAPLTFVPSMISPPKPLWYREFLENPTLTAHEHALHRTLLESKVRAETRKEMMMEMKTGVVLANIYTS